MTDQQDERERQADEDPGAYVGHEPEWAADTIPGGVGKKDERVAAYGTRSSGEGGADRRLAEPPEPSGHREGPEATDDDVREAGQNR
jgi:hypothetical protein